MVVAEQKMLKVPKLRFLEFEDGWKAILLGEIAKFSKGKGLSKSDVAEVGATPCVRYGELYTHYQETIDSTVSFTDVPASQLLLSKANDVLIPASGETQLDIAKASCVIRDGIALGGDLNIIRTEQNGVFLAYYLNSAKKLAIAQLAQGNSVVHLYSKQLQTVTLQLPTLPEQQKIASFLSAVDERLGHLARKKQLLQQYKKGVMQQLFSQQLRFKREDGSDYEDWEEKMLGELVMFFRGSPLSKSDLQENGANPCIHYGELFTTYSEIIGMVVSKTDRNIGFFSKIGDILMPSSDVTPQGLATASVLLEEGVLLGGDINILRPKSGVSPSYLSYVLNWEKKKIMVIVSGTTVKHIYNKDLALLNLKLPSAQEEQQKIADFLSSLDEKIDAVGAQIQLTQQFKKGLLQEMFV